MMNIEIFVPKYLDIIEKHNNNVPLNCVETFVYLNEPADAFFREEFRSTLDAVLQESYESGFSTAISQQQGDLVGWWNGFLTGNEREGNYPSFSEVEDTYHDIPVYSGMNPYNTNTVSGLCIVKNNTRDSDGNLVNATVSTIGDFDLEHLAHGTKLFTTVPLSQGEPIGYVGGESMDAFTEGTVSNVRMYSNSAHVREPIAVFTTALSAQLVRISDDDIINIANETHIAMPADCDDQKEMLAIVHTVLDAQQEQLVHLATLNDDTVRLNWLLETCQLYALPQGDDTCIMAAPITSCDVEGFWINDMNTSDVRTAIDGAILASREKK